MMKPRTIALLFAVCGSLWIMDGFAAAQGTAQGQFTLDNKTITLSRAYALSGPDTFDGTKQAFMVLLTEKPLAPDAIQKANSFDELGEGSVRSLVETGVILKIGADKHYHLTVRHPALKGKEIQESGFDGLEIVKLGPDRVSGTLASSSGMLGKARGDGGPEEIGMGHTARFKIRFDAPVERRFPLEEKIELAANARKLPAGGGEPGKAWIETACKPVPALPNTKDPKAVEKFLFSQGMTEKDLQQETARLSKAEGHPVTREETLKKMAEMMTAMAGLADATTPKECKVLGGSSDGKVALIEVEATMGGGRVKADVTLVKQGSAWTVMKTGPWH